jgi:DNA ligase 1
MILSSRNNESILSMSATKPGIPMEPMLAHPIGTLPEVRERLRGREFTCEHKYDGERCQIHVEELGETAVRMFGRSGVDRTDKYLDVAGAIRGAVRAPKDANSDDFVPAKSFVLDCEIVAYDRAAKRLLPFMALLSRAGQADQAKVNDVCVFAFDLLFLNGKSLLQETLRSRRDLLRRCFQAVKGEFAFASGTDCTDPEDIPRLLELAVRDGTEGLMVKTLDDEATYEPARRSSGWFKVKQDHQAGVPDSLDLVVIGASRGMGKNSGLYGRFLLACYDDVTEEFQSIGWVGTGFRDEELQRFTAKFSRETIPVPKSCYVFDTEATAAIPDVWLDTTTVWEVMCAELTLSPVHKAARGLVEPNNGIRGLAMRFPRFVRERDDKRPDQASPATLVAKMYRASCQ